MKIRFSYEYDFTFDSDKTILVYTNEYKILNEEAKANVNASLQSYINSLLLQSENIEDVNLALQNDAYFSKYIQVYGVWQQDPETSKVYTLNLGKLKNNVYFTLNVSVQDFVVNFDFTNNQTITPNFNPQDYTIEIEGQLYQGETIKITKTAKSLFIKISALNNAILPQYVYLYDSDNIEYDLENSTSSYLQDFEAMKEPLNHNKYYVDEDGAYHYEIDLLHWYETNNITFSLRKNLFEDLQKKHAYNYTRSDFYSISKVAVQEVDGEYSFIEGYPTNQPTKNADYYYAVAYNKRAKSLFSDGYYKVKPETLAPKIDGITYSTYLFEVDSDFDLYFDTIRVYKLDKDQIPNTLKITMDFELTRVYFDGAAYENGAQGEANFGLIKVETINDINTLPPEFSMNFKDSARYEDNSFFVSTENKTNLTLWMSYSQEYTKKLGIFLQDINGSFTSIGVGKTEEVAYEKVNIKFILENFEDYYYLRLIIHTS